MSALTPSITCRLCGQDALPAGQSRGRRTGRDFQLARCQTCGFGWVVDPWTEFDRIYDEDYYTGRGSDPLVDYAFEYEHPEQTIRLAEWIGITCIIGQLAPNAQRWLDFGCGNG